MEMDILERGGLRVLLSNPSRFILVEHSAPTDIYYHDVKSLLNAVRVAVEKGTTLALC